MITSDIIWSTGKERWRMQSIRYVHTNLVARNWRELVRFYVDVLECTLVPPERDLTGQWLTDLTNIEDVHIQGAHLALPGYEQQGPTLEVFSYQPVIDREAPDPINRVGLAHLAFLVDDVEAYVERIKRSGGGILGSVVKKDYKEMGTLSVAYCQDPEGNFIEIQNWSL